MTEGCTSAPRPLVLCYGGTFDPVHCGHEGVARAMIALTDCAALHVLPAARPPHRGPTAASAEDRLAMLRCAFSGDARIRVDDRELARSGRSYTVDTLASLRVDLGAEVALAWVLGADAFATFDRWYRPERILELAHLLVLPRPGVDLPWPPADRSFAGRAAELGALRGAAAGMLCMVRPPPVDVSATGVRALLAQGPADGAPGGLLSPSVWAYIRDRGLYGIRRP